MRIYIIRLSNINLLPNISSGGFKTKLKDKVVIITGSKSGIGKAIALEFAKEGAWIVVNYLEGKKEAEKTVKEIQASHSRAIAIQADVSKSKEVKKLVKKTLDKFHKINILVNNAGIKQSGKILELSEDKWDRVLDVNLKGVFLCSQAVANAMENQRGEIINISSVAGLTGKIGSANYNVSKAGVIALTKHMAVNLAPNIRVNAIAPGLIDAPFTKDMNEKTKESIINETALKRIGTPEDIAKVAVFLAADDSDFITGQTIVVDGGRVML